MSKKLNFGWLGLLGKLYVYKMINQLQVQGMYVISFSSQLGESPEFEIFSGETLVLYKNDSLNKL